MKKTTIKVKLDVTKLPNKMHLSVQQTNKAHVFKPKKGRGSYQRNNNKNFDY